MSCHDYKNADINIVNLGLKLSFKFELSFEHENYTYCLEFCNCGVVTMFVNIINEQVKYIDVQLIVINDNTYEPLSNKISHKCDVRLCKRQLGKRLLIG